MRESSSAHLRVGSAEAMRRVGAALGAALTEAASEPVVVAMEGELGAGKTTLTAGVLAAMGVAGPIRSPTYTLIEPYEVSGRRVFHIDLYRLADPQEVEALGLRDLLIGPSVLLIEWPSRGAGALPTPDLAIHLTYEAAGPADPDHRPDAAAPPASGGEPGDGRWMRVTAHSPSGARLLAALLAMEPELSDVSS
ncbi:MAG TPA: tRNA (adenosine(37)-N6)-threonylcarbamoyltransferase complex ATPase subunit type 1 TsaE [Steroidobacter sp.]|jgi:tRNA threonylcarbamoyladenosine biosynthesis protein TsaE|nr:tRNA (adenosine(37)-N6)-threonylcarbamoyltransferase complex ATPase subunit type 1 TsaE [Steroidobacteraceae bacterium]HLS81996.1 tRNA (adenosine(37)-N6)-threonylcarbamoyltransferase complex ATPase subunit type 1 TsaE [Steroidobacter sp.]